MAKQPKAEQMNIPGTERTGTIDELDEAASDYQDKKLERCEASTAEMAAKKVLHDMMKTHKKRHYISSDDLVVDLESSDETVVVQTKEQLEKKKKRGKKKSPEAED